MELRMTKIKAIAEYLSNSKAPDLPLNRYQISMIGDEGKVYTEHVSAYSPGEALDLLYETTTPGNYVQFAIQYLGVVSVGPIVVR
jgi:hypothetical protein